MPLYPHSILKKKPTEFPPVPFDLDLDEDRTVGGYQIDSIDNSSLDVIFPPASTASTTVTVNNVKNANNVIKNNNGNHGYDSFDDFDRPSTKPGIGLWVQD